MASISYDDHSNFMSLLFSLLLFVLHVWCENVEEYTVHQGLCSWHHSRKTQHVTRRFPATTLPQLQPAKAAVGVRRVETHSLQVSWHGLRMDRCTAHTHKHTQAHGGSALCGPSHTPTVSFLQSRQSGGIWANLKARWISWKNQANPGSVAGPLQRSVCPCCCWWSAAPWPG